MAKNKTMRSFLPAIALCAVLQPALAGSTAPAQPAGPAPQPVVMHASLAAAAVQPGPQATTDAAPVVVASLKGEAAMVGVPEPKSSQQEGHHPTTTAVLLTAFILMTGIALRRWGIGQS